ncbi:hypothetical protein BD779DRAFT_1798136 [Infundibulicybe gibba]|nr:hypothetical protein BD779DRAFT_1798136 [Infundibulicybe gibba]
MYLYELPTTGAIAFSDFCIDQSIDKKYTHYIPQATQARANLRAALKDCKRTDHGGKDYLRLVKLLEEYLPFLVGIIACVAHDEIGLTATPSFSWRTTLSANIFNTSPRVSFPGLYAEFTFSLLTYAFALSNLARSTVASLGNYEQDRHIPESDRKAKDDQLNVAVAFLCRASGIFTYISDTLLPDWETDREGGPTGFNKPPEFSREMNIALAKMAIADAQSLAIRKLLSKSAYDSNITPGPPLPKSHPAPALIAKLHLECQTIYSSARSLAVTSSNPSSGTSTTSTHFSLTLSPSPGSMEPTPNLLSYLSAEAVFQSALSRKWLGVDAGENGGSKRSGEAVGFLAWARKSLEDLKGSSGMKGLGIGKFANEEKGDKWKVKGRVSETLGNIVVFYNYYKRSMTLCTSNLSPTTRITSQDTHWSTCCHSKAILTTNTSIWTRHSTSYPTPNLCRSPWRTARTPCRRLNAWHVCRRRFILLDGFMYVIGGSE